MCYRRSFNQFYGIRYYDWLSANCRLLRATSKRRIHKTFYLSIPQPLPLLVEMQHSTYSLLAKINIGPHNAVVKSVTVLEEFEFLYSPFVYVTFFFFTYLLVLLRQFHFPKKTTVNYVFSVFMIAWNVYKEIKVLFIYKVLIGSN
jgi:hypothetical protein